MRIGSFLSPTRQSPICEPKRRLAWKTQTYRILPKRIAVVFVHDWCRGVACACALRRQFYVGVLSSKNEPKRSVKFYSTICLEYQTTKRRKEGKEGRRRLCRRRRSIGLIKRFASSRYTCACRSSLSFSFIDTTSSSTRAFRRSFSLRSLRRTSFSALGISARARPTSPLTFSIRVPFP